MSVRYQRLSGNICNNSSKSLKTAIIGDMPLDITSNDASSYSLRRLTRDYVGPLIKIRDSLDTSEQDIGYNFWNELNTDSIQAFINRNRLVNPTLTIDTNSNNIADNWSIGHAGAPTYVLGVSSDGQSLQLTETTKVGGVYAVQYISCVNGSTIDVSFDVKTLIASGTFAGRLTVTMYTAAYGALGDLLLETFNSTDWTNKEYKGITVTHADAVMVRVALTAWAPVIGDTGTAWFKNASAKITNASATVTTLYDQSGTGNNAVQATAENQPRIVNEGFIDRDPNNGKPAMFHLRSATEWHALVCQSGFGIAAGEARAVIFVANRANNFGVAEIFGPATTQCIHIAHATSPNTGMRFRNSNYSPEQAQTPLGSWLLNETKVAAWTFDGATTKARIDGVDQVLDDATCQFDFTLTGTTQTIGASNTSALFRGFHGYLQEMFILNSISNIEKIELNMKDYYRVK